MPKINSRQKGASGERELAHRLTDLGLPAERGQQFQGSPDSPDVKLQGMLGGKIFIECKRVERGLNLHTVMEKAVKNAGSQLPIIMHRTNRTDWLMTVRLEDGALLLRSLLLGLKVMNNGQQTSEGGM